MTTRSLSITSSVVASGVVALAALAGAPALAGGGDYQPMATPSVDSTKSRDEVRMEYLKARKEGSLPQATEAPDPAPQKSAAASTLSRDAVKAETREWLRTHHGPDMSVGGY